MAVKVSPAAFEGLTEADGLREAEGDALADGLRDREGEGDALPDGLRDADGEVAVPPPKSSTTVEPEVVPIAIYPVNEYVASITAPR